MKPAREHRNGPSTTLWAASFCGALLTLSAVGCESPCAEARDCPLGEICQEGLCLVPEALSVTALQPAVVGDTFDLAAEVRFRAATATLRVDLIGADGDGLCVPFAPRQRTLAPTDAEDNLQTVVFTGLPSAGSRFTVRLTLETLTGLANDTITLSGPDVDDDLDASLHLDGVASVRETLTSPVDHYTVQAPDSIEGLVAYVEAVPDEVSSATHGPIGGATTFSPRQPALRGEVVALPGPRGSQLLWLEGRLGGATVRCARGAYGAPGPDKATARALEVLVYADHGGDDGWAMVTVEQQTADGVVRCDRRSPDEACQVLVGTGTPEPETIDAMRVLVGDGTVRIAAMPAVASQVSEVWMSVAYEGQHVGVYGPLTLSPAAGESWIAAQLRVDAGAVVDVRDVNSVVVGAPF